jgi:hypothetical protein
MFGSGNQSVQTAVETAQLHQRQQPAEPPETRFASQLSQLEDMGFTNRQKNISALLAAGGNVNSAIEYLISSL